MGQPIDKMCTTGVQWLQGAVGLRVGVEAKKYGISKLVVWRVTVDSLKGTGLQTSDGSAI